MKELVGKNSEDYQLFKRILMIQKKHFFYLDQFLFKTKALNRKSNKVLKKIAVV